MAKAFASQGDLTEKTITFDEVGFYSHQTKIYALKKMETDDY